MHLDLADLASVQTAGRHLADTLPSLDLLVLNAGVRCPEPPLRGATVVRLASASCMPGSQGHGLDAVIAPGACPPQVMAVRPKQHTKDGFELQVGCARYRRL